MVLVSLLGTQDGQHMVNLQNSMPIHTLGRTLMLFITELLKTIKNSKLNYKLREYTSLAKQIQKPSYIFLKNIIMNQMTLSLLLKKPSQN